MPFIDPHDAIVQRKVLVAFTGGDPSRMPHFIGEAVSYMDRPTFQLQSGDKHISWSADLIREPTTEELIEYWKNRALDAEEACKLRAGP